MISLNDVLLAMSNIPVDDPLAEMWGAMLRGGYTPTVVEYTGALPITINANGEALLDYRIYGASGGVGETTENLFDIRKVNNPPKCTYSGSIFTITGQGVNYDVLCKTNGIGATPIPEKMIAVSPGTYTLTIGSGTTAPSNGRFNVRFFDGETVTNPINQDFIMPHSKTFTVENNGYLSIIVSYGNIDIAGLMLTKGSTAPESYIPYGYRLPMVTSDGTTDTDTPVYIGENQLDSVEGVSDYIDKSRGKIVRMIGEYTFTGDESFNKYGNSDVFYTSTTIDPVGITTVNTITMRCDHPAFTAIENKDTRYWLNPEADDICCFLPGGRSQVFLRSTSNFTTATECKAYLKTQYDNGTPVKISYWLKTPIEEDPPVPLPSIPTIDGTTVIDYDGDPKPSQMYVKYKGKSGGA